MWLSLVLPDGLFGFAIHAPKQCKQIRRTTKNAVLTTPFFCIKSNLFLHYEMWLSLVERCVRDAEVASSNLVISTNNKEDGKPSSLLLLADTQIRLDCALRNASSHSPPEDLQARLQN